MIWKKVIIIIFFLTQTFRKRKKFPLWPSMYKWVINNRQTLCSIYWHWTIYNQYSQYVWYIFSVDVNLFWVIALSLECWDKQSLRGISVMIMLVFEQNVLFFHVLETWTGLTYLTLYTIKDNIRVFYIIKKTIITALFCKKRICLCFTGFPSEFYTIGPLRNDQWIVL